MKKLLHFTVFLLFPAISLSQNIHITGEVLDINNGNPLSYSNIMVLSHLIGTTADKNGKFYLILNDSLKNSFLIISFVGYKSEKVKINTNENLQVRLTPTNFMISEVIVKPTKKNKPVIINDFKRSDCFLRFSTAPFDTSGNLHVPYRPAEPTIEAILFKPSEENVNKQLKEVRIALRNFGVKESVFRLRILNPDFSHAPGEDLVKSPILICHNGEKETIVNLEEYNLHFTSSGIFIGVELLIIPDNRYHIYNDANTEASLYSPFLYSLKSDVQGEYWVYSKGLWQESKFWYFKEGLWFESGDHTIKDPKTSKPILLKPAISLILN